MDSVLANKSRSTAIKAVKKLSAEEKTALIEAYKKELEDRFKGIADLIFEKLAYRTAPFRMFVRKHIYKDLQFRLLNNLLLASKVAERDGIAII